MTPTDRIPGLRESIAPALDDKKQVERVMEPPVLTTTTEPAIRLPKWAAALAGGLAALAAAAYGFLPHPWSFAAGAVALAAAFLAGVPLPAVQFTKPVVPLSLVPLLLTGAEALQALAANLASPFAQSAVMLLVALLAGLAGKTLPARVTTH
jgi:hypothetical protein